MLRLIDSLLNRITMYRLVLYTLIVWLVAAFFQSALHILAYDPFALLFTTAFLIAVAWVANKIFSRTYRVSANVESVYITALILALIVDPLKGWGDLWFIGWVAVLAMASKYILAWRGKHIFNPAAFAVALTALTVNQTASWWIGSGPMLPWVLIGGALIARKVRRFTLVFSFLGATLFTVVLYSLISATGLLNQLWSVFALSPLFFFAFVILTEPLTTPPTRSLQVYYGVIVGILFAPQVHLGGLYFTPESAILIGNMFSYLVSPKTRLLLRLKERIQIAPDIFDFVFVPDRQLAFAPGQYMEWTLGHDKPDSRGNRRYFTLASSPTENTLRLGVKFYPDASSFKQTLLNLDRRREIAASALAGDFVLPDDPYQKLVLIAGGIGITPYRSMLKYLLDTHQSRPITVFYSNRRAPEIVYRDVLDRAASELGIKTVYTLTDLPKVPTNWWGETGHINSKMIRAHVPHYLSCVFYLSGSDAAVAGFKRTLLKMRVPRSHIKTDTFSGLA